MANENTIDQSFIEEFESLVHIEYNRMGSKLRNTMRTRNGVKNKTTFQKAGHGEAVQKARGAEIKPMNIPHSNVSVTVEDWFAGEWIDDLDTLRVNHDEMMLAAQITAGALGRKTDAQIRTAAETTTNTLDETTNGATVAWASELMANFGTANVPDDGQRYIFVHWNNWAQLLANAEFSSQDYVPTESMPFQDGTQGKRWLSFLWQPYSGLSDDGTDATGLAWHWSALGHAIGADVSTNAQYYNTKDSWFFLSKMQMNAVAIDVNGIYKCALKMAFS